MKMKRLLVVSVVLLVALVAGAAWWVQAVRTPGWIDPADTALVTTGRVVYTQYCAACHGAQLQGQPNWRERLPSGRLPAPPHDESGHTWHHPDDILFDIVKNGLVPGRTAPAGYESDMPAYAGVLSDDEIRAVLAYIKSTWSPRVQGLQRDVTRQSGEGASEH